MSKNTNRLHSIILLPLLLTNIVSTDVSALSANTSDAKTEESSSFSLNLNILNLGAVGDKDTNYIIDDRGAKIDAYFAQWDLPLAGYGDEMVAASDKYGIDWRILPALAMLETTGGKNLCENTRGGMINKNAFGFGGCSLYFSTFEQAFDAVAKTISGNGEKTSHLYKDKSIEEILEVYNPKETPGITKNYHGKAIKVMNDIESMDVSTKLLAQA